MQQLSDLMGLRQKSIEIQQAQQNLDTGAYTQQSAQAGAQKAQQEMGERQLLQKVMSEGKDPDGNPLKDEKGEVNAPALHAFASKYLPLTGQGVTQAIVKTQDDRLKLNDTVRGLGQNFRNDISGVLRSSINSNDAPADINAKLDAYGKQNPDASPAIARAKSLIAHLDNVPPAQKNQALDHLAMEFQPAATTAAQTNPVMMGVTNPQGNTDIVNTNPRAPNAVGAPAGTAATGVPPGMSTFSDQAGNVWAFDPRNPGHAVQVGQGGQLPTGGQAGGGTVQPQSHASKQPLAGSDRAKIIADEYAAEQQRLADFQSKGDATNVSRSQAYLAEMGREMQSLGIQPPAAQAAPGGQSAPAGQKPMSLGLGDKQAAEILPAAVKADWDRTSAAANVAQQNIGVLQNIKKFSGDAKTGFAADRRALASSLGDYLGIPAATLAKTNTDLLAKNANMLALVGGNTDAARALAEAANPNIHMNAEAIRHAADQIIAQNKLAIKKSQYLQSSLKNADEYNHKLVDWNAAADPRILQLHEMSPEEKKALRESPEWPQFKAKAEKLHKMGVTLE